ncbi:MULTISPECIES: hypothetical protein [unclassified Synechococcus]|uniref:hypothetical protein n=1 Tax=unclassified Synechococcus TaxID=2626047 RepID=UPI002001A784|nr:hypothetical protein [Synechococcus sp. A10-1-5-1]UPM50297.1 hypothetical protein MY494_00370 [Synechococcus sp. A10-1-5-1]
MDRHQDQPIPPGASSRSGLMARLTLSAVEQLTEDPNAWREPVVHRALLISGLSVLMSALATVQANASP